MQGYDRHHRTHMNNMLLVGNALDHDHPTGRIVDQYLGHLRADIANMLRIVIAKMHTKTEDMNDTAKEGTVGIYRIDRYGADMSTRTVGL